MIKTLRITTFLAAILTILIFASLIVYGIQSNQNTEDFLDSPGIIEKFKTISGDNTQNNNNQAYPLVQQAQAFALIIDPPQPPKRDSASVKISDSGTIDNSNRQLSNSPKFTVLFTSVSENHPELSSALISDPGLGKKWVQTSEVFNHMQISEIKDGLVIVKNSDKTFEIPIEEKRVHTTVKKNTNTNTRNPTSRSNTTNRNNSTNRTNSSTQSNSRAEAAERLAQERRTAARILDTSKTTSESNKDIEELFKKVQEISGPNSKLDTEEKNQRIQELFTEFKYKLEDLNISDEEASKLNALGSLLESMK